MDKTDHLILFIGTLVVMTAFFVTLFLKIQYTSDKIIQQCVETKAK